MKIAIVIPNWNGADMLAACLKSLEAQTQPSEIVVVDNASSDGSIELVEKKFPKVTLLKNTENLGFAGGVNTGIRYAIGKRFDAIALFNNDAVANKNWLKELAKCLEKDESLGAVTTKLLNADGTKIDSTGDYYSIWGLTIARQRDKPAAEAPAEQEKVFGASAGASLYRTQALEDIGLFDEKFFAYYEDTDVSFRMQLRGWKTLYCPTAIAHHATGSTSSKLEGFTLYQTMKNLPMLFFKDVPPGLMPKMWPRFTAVYYLIFFNSIVKGRGGPAIKGHLTWLKNIPYTYIQRRRIQKNKQVTTKYISEALYNDLPPDAKSMRRFFRPFNRV